MTGCAWVLLGALGLPRLSLAQPDPTGAPTAPADAAPADSADSAAAGVAPAVPQQQAAAAAPAVATPPAPPPKKRRPFIAVRAGAGASVLWRPAMYSMEVHDRVRNGEFVTESSRFGPAFTLHGGLALTLSLNFSLGVEYRYTRAHLTKQPGAFDELGLSLDPTVTVRGFSAYAQGRSGHLVGGASFAIVGLEERVPKGASLSFNGDPRLEVETYELGGTLGYQGWFVGDYPSALGWHAVLALGMVGLNPFAPLRIPWGPIRGSDVLEAASLGADVGFDFN